MGLLINLALSAFFIFGSYIAYSSGDKEKTELVSISLGFGTMACLLIVELLPEALESFNDNYLLLIFWIGIGVIILKLLDGLVPEHDHYHGLSHDCTKENVKHIGIVSSLALILHNLVEGMAVYSISATSINKGLMMMLSIGLHNVVMGMVIYATLREEKKEQKFLILGLTALSTFIGGVLMKLLWQFISDTLIGILLALASGMLIFITVFELAPHLLHSNNKKSCLIYALIGVVIVLVSTMFE